MLFNGPELTWTKNEHLYVLTLTKINKYFNKCIAYCKLMLVNALNIVNKKNLIVKCYPVFCLT